jgi:hypothetical protein
MESIEARKYRIIKFIVETESEDIITKMEAFIENLMEEENNSEHKDAEV